MASRVHDGDTLLAPGTVPDSNDMFEGIESILNIVMSVLLLWALSRAQFRWLLREGRVSRLLALGVCEFLLWQIRVQLPGAELHLLGTTVMTLMFGWEFALLGGCVALSLDALRQHWPLASAGLMAWTLVAVPVGTSYLFARLVERVFPRHFFVYVYVTAYAGGALAMLLHGLAMILLTVPITHFDGTTRFLPYVLMSFGEAFVSGGLMTLLVAYRPEWVVSFEDRLYVNEH